MIYSAFVFTRKVQSIQKLMFFLNFMHSLWKQLMSRKLKMSNIIKYDTKKQQNNNSNNYLFIY